jgi:hypothetical protein
MEHGISYDYQKVCAFGVSDAKAGATQLNCTEPLWEILYVVQLLGIQHKDVAQKVKGKPGAACEV